MQHAVGIIRLPEVVAISGLSRSRIYELEKKGRFPARRKLSDRASGWLESEVVDWVQSRPVVGSAVS